MPSAPDSKSGLDFRDLQRWFLERVVGPHRRAGAPGAPQVPERAISAVIRPSATLTAEQRMRIYTDQYIWRLEGIVAQEHPTLEEVMGRDAFIAMVRDYLSRFPPNDYTLNDLCHALPYYIERYRERDDAPLLHDIARLERAISDAYDSYPVGRVSADDLASVSQEHWPYLRFRMDPSVRVMAFDHDVLAAYDARSEGRDLPELSPRPTWAVVWRHEHKIWRQSVTRARYQALAALAAGQEIITALERASEVWDASDEALETTVFRWFSEWVEQGFFSSLIRPAS